MKSMQPRLPELDAIRGLAVSLVLFLHLFFFPYRDLFKSALPHAVYRILELSWCGVDIFFVLSGFLIGGVILDHCRADNFLKVFFLRRAARILPLYFILLLVAYVTAPYLPAHPAALNPPWLTYSFFVANFWFALGYAFPNVLGPIWSLCIEEQFYLIAPLLIPRFPTRFLPWGLLGIAVGNIFLRFILHRTSGAAYGINTWAFTFCRTDGLALGILAAWAMRNGTMRRWLLRRASAIFAFATASLCLFALSPRLEAYYSGEWRIFVFSLGWALILALLGSGAKLPRQSWLRFPWLIVAGKYSYFLYLFHCLIYEVLWTSIHSQHLGVRVAALGLTWGGAYLSQRFFEGPLMQYARQENYLHLG